MRKKRILIGLSLATVFVAGLAACTNSSTPTSNPTTTPSVEPTPSSTTPTQSSSTPEPTPSSSVAPDPYAEYTKIATKDEFLAFRNTSGTVEGKFVLTADIDLEGVTLEESKISEFKGTFDGNGHAIKNATLVSTAAKIGILFNGVVGGTVTNVKFTGCSITTTSESCGIVSGLCEGGTFSKIEFNACSSVTGNNYSGLLYARNTLAKTINISEITSKNGCATSSAQYGGFLVSDMVAGTTLNVSNCDLDGELKKSSGNGSFVAGRVRGGNVNITDSVLRAKVANPSNNGLLVGGGSDAIVTVTNTLIEMKDTATTIFGKNKSKTAASAASDKNSYTLSNVYFVGGTVTDDEKALQGLSEVEATAVTPTWLNETLDLDFDDVWMTEGENNAKYRLKASSTNVKSADATLAKIKIQTSNTKVRFKKGENFSSEGIIVFGTYSDDVQLVLNSDQYTIDSTTYNKDAVDTYTITVKGVEDATKTATYTVSLVEQTGFAVNDEFVKKTYATNEDLDLKNLKVYSVWSDQVNEELAASEYTVDSTAYTKTAGGKYTISVTNGSFAAQTFNVSVVATKPAIVDKHVYVNVAGGANIAQEGQLVNGVETFTTVSGAISFLESCQFADDVVKVVYVADGTYHEKITTALNNLHLIGQGENTKITYSAVESTVNPLKGLGYGLDCATLHINGKNFAAENIQIRNDFDYINEAANEASPQGLALTINGDGAVLNNVHLYGNQDTLFLKSGRTYFKSCTIEGNVDFIFGEATGIAYFDTCTIKAVYRGSDTNNGYITAMRATAENQPDYGYVFDHCTITADEDVKAGSMSLGRPWGAKATVAFLNCSFSDAYSKLGYTDDDKTKSRWFSMSGNSPLGADFVEYASTGDGAITEAVRGGRILTEEEAADYTLANVLAKTNGNATFTLDVDFPAALTALEAEATTTAPTAVAVTPATATTTAVEVEKGSTANLAFAVTPWNANAKNVAVTIADETICSYDGTKVTGLKPGTTTITFTLGTIDVVVDVTVKAPSGQYTVKFYDGTTEVDSFTGAPTTAIVFPNTDKSGYKFVRYYADANFTKEFTATELGSENVDVYLRYIELGKAGVTYVSTADQLIEALGKITTNQQTVYITEDIEMSNATTAYAGTTNNNNSSFYGFGYAIKNWNPTFEADSMSFFGKLSGGTIDGVIFKDCTVTVSGAKKYDSLFASGIYTDEIVSNITFNNCAVTSADGSGTYLALLSGAGCLGEKNSVTKVTVKNINSIGSTVTGGQYTGGLFGYANAGDIEVDGLTGSISVTVVGSSSKNAGGVIGWVKDHVFTLKNANATLNVTNGNGSSGGKGATLGGVVGGQQYSAADKSSTVVITDSKLVVNLFNAGSYNGGIIGSDSLTYTDSTKTVVVNGTSNLTITNTDITFDIKCMIASQNVAGITGRTQAPVANITLNNVKLKGSILAADYDGSTKNYATVLGNSDSGTVVSFTNVSILEFTTKVYAGQKVNTVIANGTTNATEVAKVTYYKSKVDVKNGDEAVAIANLQGTPLSDVIKADVTITFGTDGNYNSTSSNYFCGNAVINCGSHTSEAQVKQGTIELTVAAGATVVITGYNGYTHYTVAIDDGAASAEITDYTYTIEATNAEKTIIIDCDPAATGQNYLTSIAVTFPSEA